jgi:hypothetical protein
MQNDWENVVKQLEDLLRKMGWSEVKMCEEMWRFVGVDVDEFRMHGIEPCAWLEGLESLRDLRRPYWFGFAMGRLVIKKLDDKIRLELDTKDSIDAVFYPTLLKTVKMPRLDITQGRETPAEKPTPESITLSYHIDLGINEWPWPIELSAGELERILDGFGDGELAEFVAGAIDGGGAVWYKRTAYVGIMACKDCPKRFILDVLKRVITERFGITGTIKSRRTKDALVFRGKNAIKLLGRVVEHLHHPLRRLRAELILAYYSTQHQGE